MSNQVFKNQTERYIALKVNEYRLSANIVTTNDTDINVQFDTVVKDEIGSNLQYTNGVFTVLAPDALGIYIINLNIVWQAQGGGVGFRRVFIRKNIETITRVEDRRSSIGGTSSDVNLCSATIVLDKVGDIMEIIARQTSGGALNIQGFTADPNTNSNLEIYKLN